MARRMRSPLLTTAAACLSALVAACGGGGPLVPAACSTTNQKQFVLDVTRDWYLFQNDLPATVNIGDYPTAQELSGSDVMNDALLSGNLDFASLGTNGLAIIWAKTKGTPVEVQGAAGFNFMPLALVTREANVKSVADYAEKHKFAVPAVRVSNQAILLQMTAAKQFGHANYAKLDSLTVSMTHPDAMAALLSGAGEIGSHFASAPFLQKELERPGIRQIVSSTEILGGHINFNILATTTKFHSSNPKA